MHPLNGKYIVFRYGEQDHEAEGWALALFQLESDNLESVYSPAFTDPISLGERNNQRVVDILKSKGVTEVYTISRSRDFFDIPYQWQSLEESEDASKPVEEWSEFAAVYEWNDEYMFLTEHGIRVHRFDNRPYENP